MIILNGSGRLPITIRIETPDEMRELGRRLAAVLRAGDLVILSGPLGAGKTTLTKGIADGLGVRGPVTSPTFVIARVHPPLRPSAQSAGTGGTESRPASAETGESRPASAEGGGAPSASAEGGRPGGRAGHAGREDIAAGLGGTPPSLVHADAYRLGSALELDDLDLDADLANSITVVEWGEGRAEGLSEDRLEIAITPASPPSPDTEGTLDGDDGDVPREVKISGAGSRWQDIQLPPADLANRL